MPRASSRSMCCKRLLLSLVSVGLVAADNCKVPPLTLPLSNVTFANGIGLNRGIPIQLGGQPEGLRLTFTLNNTRVRNANDCAISGNSTAVIICQGSSGSIFNTSASPTWKSSLENNWNVTSIDPRPDGVTVIQGYDTALFSDNVTIPSFPFEVWSDSDAANKSVIGLGTVSSFLQKFEDYGFAPSRYAVGLFFGSRSQDFGRDGELVIGGYDQGKLADGAQFTEWDIKNYTNTELPIVCPLQVHLQNIILNNSQGSFPLSADPLGQIPACIDPLQNEFTFTQAMYAIWAKYTNHTIISTDGSPNFTNQTYPASLEPLLGNITVILSNGYTTVIPHYELVSFERGDDAEGKYAVINSSRVMSAVGSGGGASDYGVDIPLLGGVFLSQNYLRVDYARGKFGLAPAVTTTQGETNIQPICYGTDAAAAAHKGKSSAGAIAGGVVGGLAGLALVAAAVYFLWFRKRKSPRRRSRPALGERAQTRSSEAGRSWGTDAEMDRLAMKGAQSTTSPFATPLISSVEVTTSAPVEDVGARGGK